MNVLPHVTVLYAGLLGLFSILVANNVGTARKNAGVSIGDGGDMNLIAAMRAHANFVEYTPMALLIIALLELNGVTIIAIHALGAALLVSRVAHFYGMGVKPRLRKGRFVGIMGTAIVTFTASGWAVVLFFLQ